MKFPIATACVLTLSACAGSNATRNSRDAAPSQNADFIMAEELAGTNGSTAYDAVQQLRPAWILRSRPKTVVQGSQSQLLVYVDGMRYAAGIESLRLVPIRAVLSLQYFSPGSAEGRFGPGHLLGAIEVVTAAH
jgi:hypothetical protein